MQHMNVIGNCKLKLCKKIYVKQVFLNTHAILNLNLENMTMASKWIKPFQSTFNLNCINKSNS